MFVSAMHGKSKYYRFSIRSSAALARLLILGSGSMHALLSAGIMAVARGPISPRLAISHRRTSTSVALLSRTPVRKRTGLEPGPAATCQRADDGTLQCNPGPSGRRGRGRVRGKEKLKNIAVVGCYGTKRRNAETTRFPIFALGCVEQGRHRFASSGPKGLQSDGGGDCDARGAVAKRRSQRGNNLRFWQPRLDKGFHGNSA